MGGSEKERQEERKEYGSKAERGGGKTEKP